MKSKLKFISITIAVLFLSCVCGAIYYINAVRFDNNKQYQAAEKFYEQEKYQEAYVGFLKIKYFSKYHRIALLKQGMSAEKLGDWPIAENKFEQYVKKYPGTTFAQRAEYSLAKSYYMNKKYDKAIRAFLKIKTKSPIEDYRFASDYFLGKIALSKNMITQAKKYYFNYLTNSPTGTYALTIAYDAKDMALSAKESVMVSKVFLANQKYDEAIVVLKDVPKMKSWTYLAIAYYYKNDYEKFKKFVSEGYSQMASGIDKEDLKNFTGFYLSMQKDYKKAIEDLQKSGAGKVIPDYLQFKHAQFLPNDKKIEAYKQIVKKYPKSECISDCLVEIFFDFANKNELNSAIKVGEIYIDKFADTPQESQILFWTGKYLQRIKRPEIAKKFFAKVIEKYPSSYYAFRASRAEMSSNGSWVFAHNFLPNSKTFGIEFPYDNLTPKDVAVIKLFLRVNDNAIWEEVPFNNAAIRSWYEFKKGNSAKSIYYANKYITESKEQIPYTSSVWKLAYPIYYSEDINENCKMRNLDPFLILSLIREESHFRDNAISSSNAIGLMQLMMPTAAYIAEKSGIQPPDEIKLQNSKYNIALGTAYFSYVLDETDNFPMYAIGGYNGGPNAMNKWRKTIKIVDSDDFVEKIPYGESQNYIKKVYRSRYNYSKIYEKN